MQRTETDGVTELFLKEQIEGCIQRKISNAPLIKNTIFHITTLQKLVPFVFVTKVNQKSRDLFLYILFLWRAKSVRCDDTAATSATT